MEEEVKFHPNIFDSNQKNLYSSSKIICEPIFDKIDENLQKEKLVFIATNQKGSSACFVCNNCGYIPNCKRCDKNYYISSDNYLVCPVCRKKKKLIKKCPKCNEKIVRYVGIGEKRLFDELRRLFGNSEVLFINEESRKKEELIKKNRVLLMRSGIVVCSPNFLKVAKFNNNSGLIVFLNADKSLFWPDYTAKEINYSFIASILSDRYKVFIQTKYPQNETLIDALNNNFKDFYEKEIMERKSNCLPPFLNLIKFVYRDKSEVKALKNLEELNNLLKDLDYNFELYIEPFPGYPPKIRSKYVFNLVIGFNDKFDKKSADFLEIIAFCSQKDIRIDVDPLGLI